MSDSEEKSAPTPAETEQKGEAAEENAPRATVERSGAYECAIRIEADADYLRERYQKELQSLQAEVKLPGFRRGHAPLGLVERRMGSTVRTDLIASVVAEAYDKAVEDNNLTVVAQKEGPDLEKATWEPGQPAEFVFKCDVLPQVEVQDKDYKDLAVEVPALEMTPELLQTEMERFTQQFATWEEVTGPGIDWDDYVEAEVSVPEVNWTETIGFYPRSERIGPFTVEGIKGVLSGVKVGDKVEVDAVAHQEQAGRRPQLEPLAGQKVKIRLHLQRVTRRKVPELNEEFAHKIGVGSVQEVEKLVRERLQQAVADRKAQVTRQVLVERVLENVPCELPPTLVDRAAEEEQLRRLVRLLRMGVQRQEAERMAAEHAAQNRANVERGLQATYVLRRIAEKERIIVTETEVDGQIRAFASRQSWREERARSYMEERGMLRALRDDMRESKTEDFLVQHAQVKEIPPEEFAKKHQHEEPTGAPQAGEGGSA